LNCINQKNERVKLKIETVWKEDEDEEEEEEEEEEEKEELEEEKSKSYYSNIYQYINFGQSNHSWTLLSQEAGQKWMKTIYNHRSGILVITKAAFTNKKLLIFNFNYN